jgi:hypothetical protein
MKRLEGQDGSDSEEEEGVVVVAAACCIVIGMGLISKKKTKEEGGNCAVPETLFEGNQSAISNPDNRANFLAGKLLFV